MWLLVACRYHKCSPQQPRDLVVAMCSATTELMKAAACNSNSRKRKHCARAMPCVCRVLFQRVKEY
jgi:hypothetical protein